MHIKKLSVVIPIYNEERTIEELLNRVLAVDLGKIEKEIVLIDDGSTDGSTEILKKLQSTDSRLKIVLKERNAGKGDTLRIGFKYTTGDYIIVQDADLEYDPEDYKKLIRAVEEYNADVVYGSRFSGNYEQMSSLHYFGNKLLTLVTNILFGVLLTDMETCYKLIPGDFARNIEITAARFNFEPEITAKILRSGLRIREVPISYNGRAFSEGKKITWKDGIAALFTLVKFRFVK